jgi:hypothetical protein
MRDRLWVKIFFESSTTLITHDRNLWNVPLSPGRIRHRSVSDDLCCIIFMNFNADLSRPAHKIPRQFIIEIVHHHKEQGLSITITSQHRLLWFPFECYPTDRKAILVLRKQHLSVKQGAGHLQVIYLLT